MSVDLLAFAPHPDDAELGVGGILALHARKGRSVAVVDLTAGELGSNGDPATRSREAEAAARALGVTVRENLGLPDGALGADPDQVRPLVAALRRLRPRVVLHPVGPDRHPDHEAAEALIRRALFLSGLHRFDAGPGDPRVPHRPVLTFGYPIHRTLVPDLVVDVSAVYESKQRALAAYQSQFGPSDRPTYVNRPAFLSTITARDAYFGGLIGAAHGEGLLRSAPLPVRDLVDLA